MHLQELKSKTAADLLAYAEELEIENASTLRTQDMMFAILKQLAENDVVIRGTGVLEVLSDGFGFLRAPESNYLPGPDDIYISPSQVRRFGLRARALLLGDGLSAPADGPRRDRRRRPCRLTTGLVRTCKWARPHPAGSHPSGRAALTFFGRPSGPSWRREAARVLRAPNGGNTNGHGGVRAAASLANTCCAQGRSLPH